MPLSLLSFLLLLVFAQSRGFQKSVLSKKSSQKRGWVGGVVCARARFQVIMRQAETVVGSCFRSFTNRKRPN